MMNKNLQLIREVFEAQGIEWVEPYSTTEGAINRKEVGNHVGLYYIYPEKNFYFGKATKDNTVIERHKTHRAKLDVDLAGLYSTPVEKAEAKWQFPQGWKEAVCEHIIEGVDSIPNHFVKVGPKRVAPGVLDFPVTHKVDVDTLPVLVWDLSHLTTAQIAALEKAIIPTIWPYANAETSRKRRKENG